MEQHHTSNATFGPLRGLYRCPHPTAGIRQALFNSQPRAWMTIRKKKKNTVLSKHTVVCGWIWIVKV